MSCYNLKQVSPLEPPRFRRNQPVSLFSTDPKYGSRRMVKPNRWLLTAGIFAVFAFAVHRVVAGFNKAWEIW